MHSCVSSDVGQADPNRVSDTIQFSVCHLVIQTAVLMGASKGLWDLHSFTIHMLPTSTHGEVLRLTYCDESVNREDQLLDIH